MVNIVLVFNLTVTLNYLKFHSYGRALFSNPRTDLMLFVVTRSAKEDRPTQRTDTNTNSTRNG